MALLMPRISKKSHCALASAALRRIVGGLAAVLMAHASVTPAMAQLPTGGSVAAGSVTIGTSGNTMTVNQGSQNAIVNWNSLSIGQGNTVNINQPNSLAAMLARVTGNTPSTIAGQLNANGQVFLINPTGIAITSTGTVNVGGGFVASTLGMTDAEFLGGRAKFTGTGASASVSNAGLITVGRGGYAALLGGMVSNTGRIVVPLGKVALGSGEAATLDVSGDAFLQVAIPTESGGKQVLIQQKGTIVANGGSVIISAATARTAARDAVNMSGTVQTNTIGGQTGSIDIIGGEGGGVEIGGLLQATGSGHNYGGSVAVSGSTLLVSGKIDTSGAQGGRVALADTRRATVSGTVKATGRTGTGGTITATAPTLALKGATLDASGATGGGTISLGGGLHGGGTLAHSNIVTIDSATTIAANATETGNGGSIVVWSDQSTDFAGLITARGGANGGNGGNVEVSSKAVLGYNGLTVLTAASGVNGTLLLDPDDIYIVGGGSAAAPAGWSTIGVTTLAAQLAVSSVVLDTSTGSGGNGNIILAAGADLAWTSTSRLTLAADNSIVLAGTVTAPNGSLTLTAPGSITDTASAAVSASAIDLTAATISLAGTWQANGGLFGISGHDGVLISSTAQVLSDAANGGTVNIVSGGGGVVISGLVAARGTAGSGGTILVNGVASTALSGATIDASGTGGGGTVSLGGIKGSLTATADLTLDANTTINANTTGQGNGGSITAWSNGTSDVWGTLTATGGALGGNGGSIETSGHLLDVTGITINAAAANGVAGTWLLDPYNLTVSGAATT